MNILTILLLIPVTIIILHFISYEITKLIKTKLYRNRHIEFEINKFTTHLGLTFSPNSVIIYFGGMSLCVLFNPSNPDSTSEPDFYSLGFFSIDSELIWRTFYFFNHSFELPWSTCSVISETTLDPSTHLLTTEYVPILTFKNKIYHDKYNNPQPVQTIDWYLIRTKWTNQLFHFLHLNIPTKTKTYLEFHTTTGIGSERDTWKGGVTQSSINLPKETIKLLNRHLKSNTPDSYSKLITSVESKINSFMISEHKY